MEASEIVHFNNDFGTITSKRVIIIYKKGKEEIPLSQITSVSFQHERSLIFSIGGFLLGVICLFGAILNSDLSGQVVAILIFLGIFAFLSGLANWIGHHNIILSAGGNNRKPIKVEMAKTKEGRQFYNEIRARIF